MYITIMCVLLVVFVLLVFLFVLLSRLVFIRFVLLLFRVRICCSYCYVLLLCV